jgi:hypothetical protein
MYPDTYRYEAPLQRDCQSYLKTLAAKGVPVSVPYKTHGNRFTQSGIADILVCIYGVFVALECKVGNNKASESQALYLQSINKAGGIGRIVRHPLEIEGIVREAFKSKNNLSRR